VSQFKAKIFILWEDLKKNKENNNDGWRCLSRNNSVIIKPPRIQLLPLPSLLIQYMIILMPVMDGEQRFSGIHTLTPNIVVSPFFVLGYPGLNSGRRSVILTDEFHYFPRTLQTYACAPKLRGLSPQANYTDRATAAVGEVVPFLRIEGCCVVSATGPHGR
jgi:hypothetical protein